MNKIGDKTKLGPNINTNLKDLRPVSSASKSIKPDEPKNTNDVVEIEKKPDSPKAPPLTDPAKALAAASELKNKLKENPVLPLKEKENKTQIDKKIQSPYERFNYIKKPAVIFIEGFSLFGISNGDGIKDMAENFPGAKRFSWDEKAQIVNEIKKHTQDQPIVLVGHSFGGDTAVEIADELNSAKNGFRTIDLLVSLDSVGLKNNIMPINVKRNLNFFQEGIVPFLNGSPNIARNTKETEVINELRSELHSKIEDSNEVQYKIFEEIRNTINETNEQNQVSEIVIALDLSNLPDNFSSLLKKE